ncbi:hypothetical protein QY890_01175 [Latilactobacillus sakei]
MQEWQPPRGRCRLAITDLENYLQTDPKYVLHINRTAFRKKYEKKCRNGNELLILQGTKQIDQELRGIFIIDGYRTNLTGSMIFVHRQSK